MAITVASPTAGTLQIAGAVVAGTIVGGAFVPIAQGGVQSVNGATGAVVFTYVASVNGSTGALTLVPLDTGWAANEDQGNKLAVIGNATGYAAIAAALDALAAGSGTLLVAVAAKCAAIEYALANNLRPNA